VIYKGLACPNEYGWRLAGSIQSELMKILSKIAIMDRIEVVVVGNDEV
jgi:hypothetical protein